MGRELSRLYLADPFELSGHVALITTDGRRGRARQSSLRLGSFARGLPEGTSSLRRRDDPGAKDRVAPRAGDFRTLGPISPPRGPSGEPSEGREDASSACKPFGLARAPRDKHGPEGSGSA